MGTGGDNHSFLKDCIAEAFVELLGEKPPEKITAEEITRHAGVGRATLFRNFDSKQEILVYRLVRLWEKWVEANDVDDISTFSLKSTEILFSFNYANRELIEIIYRYHLQNTIYDAFHRIMQPYFGTDPMHCYANSFYSYGCFGLIDEWVRRGFRETPAEMAEIIINGIVGENVRLEH